MTLFPREMSEILYHIEQAGLNQVQRTSHLNDIGIISNECRGGTQVDYGRGLWSCLRKCVNVTHDIMSCETFLPGCRFKVDIIQLLPHGIQLLIGYRQAQLPLAFRQGEPEAPPGAELVLRAEKPQH